MTAGHAVPERAERCGRIGCLLAKGVCGGPGWSVGPGPLKSALPTVALPFLVTLGGGGLPWEPCKEPSDESGATVDASQMWQEDHRQVYEITKQILQKSLGL